MIVLKLRRVGKRGQPTFRLVVDEKRHKNRGNATEYLGWYNPRDKKNQFDKEKILSWLKKGAQKTQTVHNLLINAGVIEGKKIAVHKSRRAEAVGTPTEASGQSPKKEEATAAPAAPVAEAPKVS